MKKEFIKMHGLGNDFAVFDARTAAFAPTMAHIAAWGDRHTGIGFDQMVIIDLARTAGTDAFMRIYNCDGGEVGACGNATRCVAALLMDEMKESTVILETKANILTATRAPNGVTVDMGEARLNWKEIPLSHEQNTEKIDVEVGVLRHPVGVNVGNPHAVFFLHDEKIEAVPLAELGPRVEHHPLFPARVNVEIVNVESPTHLRMRVWERGAGITRACGTGACAAAVAGVRLGLCARKTTVALEGGTLDIEWRESDNHVLMTGAAAEVFRGAIEV